VPSKVHQLPILPLNRMFEVQLLRKRLAILNSTNAADGPR